MRAKKYLGQHFLRDTNAAIAIAKLCEATAEETVLEIGPGTGNLTEALLTHLPTKHIVAIETDEELIPRLQERFSDPRLEIVRGNATQISFDTLPQLQKERRNIAVGNLPYNVGTEIYFHLLDHRTLFRRLVLMLQREVADRIAAGPGSKAYGILSVLTALWGSARVSLRLPPEAFNPPPKVHSAVVTVDLETSPRLDVGGDPEGFTHMVRAAFGMRRKTLVNALSHKGWSRTEVEKALDTNSFDLRIRAEALQPEELALLWRTLQIHALAAPRTNC